MTRCALAGLALGLSLLLLFAGCDEPATQPTGPPDHQPLPDFASLFDPATTGTIAGQVTWLGPRPTVKPFRSRPRPLSGDEGGPVESWPNPHAPQISPEGGVGNSVVFLRQVGPRRARPWDHPPVRVELRDYQISVLQGPATRSFGFVRRGATVEMTSMQDVFHSLQGRGAGFFARTFPEPGLVCQQRLLHPGVVELMSGSGAYWMRGHLFVADHPYFAATDAEGRFALERVPPGDYEVVCWLPDWRVANRELDADTGLIWRLTFQPPRTITQSVSLRAGEKQEVEFRPAGP